MFGLILVGGRCLLPGGLFALEGNKNAFRVVP